MRRHVMLVAAAALSVTAALAPRTASAEGLFDMLFGGFLKQQPKSAPQVNFLADPFGLTQQLQPSPRFASSGSGPAFCVRSCDGRYFPLTTRGGASAAQMCQAFCPASPTKVFYGSSIDGAWSANGERYAESENAFAYRKAMRAECTCNGHNAMGLAPIDLTLDTSLRPGDVIATTSGLVAYSGIKVGLSQNVEFTPVASYPGLTAEVRALLGEMKVAPVAAEMIASDAAVPEARRDVVPVTSVPKAVSTRAKRAALD
jgi:hypothetical protein